MKTTSAPEWMKCRSKTQFLNFAALKPEEREFQIIYGNFLNGRKCCKFRVLFFTEYISGMKCEFVAMDKTCGNLYHINYEEDHTEGSSYAISKSILLDEKAFTDILDKYEKVIPGITGAFQNYFKDDWKKYLTIKQKQILNHWLFVISYTVEDQRRVVLFKSANTVPIRYSYPIEVYEERKKRKFDVLDDLLEIDEIAQAEVYKRKGLGIWPGHIQRCINEIAVLADDCDDYSGDMDVLLIKNGLVWANRNGICNKAIEERLNEFFYLLRW